MGSFLQNMAGMGNITEQIIATDFLLSTKDSVKNYASAITEATTPQVRTVLKKHLEDAIYMHEKIINYMVAKGYYQAYNPQEQIKADIEAVDTVLNL